MTLRPIGTEIEFCYPPFPSCSDPTFHLWRYRIIGHSETSWGPGETLEPLECTKYMPDSYKFDVFGRLLPVPPKEIAHHFWPQ